MRHATMINGRTLVAAALIESAVGIGTPTPALAADESPASPAGTGGAPVTGSPGSAGATAAARHRIDAVSIAALVAAGEPPLMELREAATALVMAQPERARSLLSRAGAAGWLPEVRVRVDRRFGRDESLDYGRTSLDDAAPVGMNTHQDVRYEVRATWDLSRIVFNPDELGAHMEALRIADVRREVEMMVVRLVFERRRLKTEAATSDSPDITPRLRRELRVQEIEAELDALTGGAFSRPRNTRTSNAASQTP
ncbi:MAG TPA: hypothetical protein VNO55_11680 [Polyangia bacterium]|nr:hypothetical protein [Polyangia bacterium]